MKTTPPPISVVLCLAVAASLVSAGHAATDRCCAPTAGSAPYLSYTKPRDGSPVEFYGYASIAYPGSCGACTTASFNLVNKRTACTFQGKLPQISAYKCTYSLSTLTEYVANKVKRTNVPCTYSSSEATNINSTHYKSCSGSFIGIATVEVDLSGPKSAAKIDCSGLFASFPISCSINSFDGM